MVSLISTFHDVGMVTCTKYNKEILKPSIVVDYNKSMGGVDLRDQLLENYLMERKRGTKWYISLQTPTKHCCAKFLYYLESKAYKY